MRALREVGALTVSLVAEQEQAAAGCVVLGDPAYCGRFGFRVVPGLVYPGADGVLHGAGVRRRAAPGEVVYHAAFASEA